MAHVEFVILCGLLLWVLWRMEIPWRADRHAVIVLRKLNRIEACVRNLPVEEVERELAGELEAIEAQEKGRPLWGPRWWDRFYR